MRRSDAVVATEAVALVAACAVSFLLPPAGPPAIDALWFLMGLSVLTFSDVWLPRGDAIGMSATLVLGAVLLFDVRLVLVLIFLAQVLALVPRGRKEMWRQSVRGLTAQAVAAVVTSAVLIPMALHPSTGILRHAGVLLAPKQYACLLFAGALFASLEFALVQLELAFRTNQPIFSTLLGGFSFGGWLIAAHASAGILAAVMYRTMSGWGLIVAVIMILLMRQSFVLLLDIRQAYKSTIDVLIRVVEAQSPGREGIAERNASISIAVGRAIGLHGRELERVRYSALLLDVGLQEGPSDFASSSRPAPRIVGGVEFLSDVVPILELCNGTRSPVRSRADLVCSYIVLSVATATESIDPSRLAQLTDRVSPSIRREVNRAVEAALEAGQSERLSQGVAGCSSR